MNDERFSEILNSEIQKGFVSIIDYFGYKGKSNSIQIEAYFLLNFITIIYYKDNKILWLQ